MQKFKAFWNTINLEFQRIFIFCRKIGFARLSAVRTSEDFNPAIAGHAQYALRIDIVPPRNGATIKLTHYPRVVVGQFEKSPLWLILDLTRCSRSAEQRT